MSVRTTDAHLMTESVNGSEGSLGAWGSVSGSVGQKQSGPTETTGLSVLTTIQLFTSTTGCLLLQQAD